jgi:hypothetical protein
MNEVDTVFIVASDRGSYVVSDIVRSIKWTCANSCYVVIVDLAKNVSLPQDMGIDYTVLNLENYSFGSGFARNIGIKWAIDNGIRCKQFVCVSDSSLIMQPGLDMFLLKQMTKTQIGLLGVQSMWSASAEYDSVVGCLAEWDLPYSKYRPEGFHLVDSIHVISYECAKALFEANALVRNDVGKWPLSYAVFMSWVAQMLGFYQVGWGMTCKQMPPFYVNPSSRNERRLPAPHLLSTRFMFYDSLRCVEGYSEEEIREVFKIQRGEDAIRPDPMRPVVVPDPEKLTVAG